MTASDEWECSFTEGSCCGPFLYYIAALAWRNLENQGGQLGD